MTRRPHQGEEPVEAALPSRAALLRWVLAAVLGAGGGAAERQLFAPEASAASSPAEALRQANHEVAVQLRLQRLEDRAATLERAQEKLEGRTGKLEDLVRPASYRTPAR